MHVKGHQVKFIYLFAFIIVFSCASANAERTILRKDLEDKMRGMWLGQLIGNYAGRSTEGHYQSNPNPEPNAPWILKADPDGWGADDDTDIEYIAMHILEANGLDCNSQTIARQWQKHITSSGIYISNKQAWYLMGDDYVPPLTGCRTYNEHWYSIDSQITTEVLGAISPGLVQAALDLTKKFATVSNEGFPVHAAQFYAVIYANAFFEPNVVTLINQGLEAIPNTSRTHNVITDALNWYLEDVNDGDPNWRQSRQKLYDYYMGAYDNGRYYYWIESTINTGATTLAILYGQGDYKETVQIGVLAGWDNDCNPATAGGLIGIINGYSGLPGDLTDPNICGNNYKNVYRPYLPDPNQYVPQYDTITNIAFRMADLAEENILEPNNYLDPNNCGYITNPDDPNTKTYHLPTPKQIVPEAEKQDPNGPYELVYQALDAGIQVTTSASVEYHITTEDRRNLDSIIDGIVDNSYNGHKAYYSYLSDPILRPQKNWYQLNFSEPVKFETLSFYEGDLIWQEGNTYCKYDTSRGGFFTDLTVEILRDGKFIQPANLQMSEPLARCKIYQIITFTFSPTVGDAVRIIGTPGGTQQCTTIMELEATGNTDPGLYVASVRINDGQLQRSTLADVNVVFNRDVTIAPNDIELTGTTNGTVIDADQIDFAYSSSSYRLRLKFDMDDDEIFTDSLPDDTYQLKLNCSKIKDGSNNYLLDDDKDPSDDFYTIEFHRLFGDADGSAGVDFWDFSFLALQWLDSPGQTGLDYNKNNNINSIDLGAFTANWLCEF